MGKVWYTAFCLQWHNPYTQPPSGEPRHKVRVVLEGHRPCPVPAFLYNHTVPGDDWVVTVDVVKVPGKKWSDERKYKYRKKMLLNRMQKKYPMFADEMYQQALQEKPEYYGLGEVGE